MWRWFLFALAGLCTLPPLGAAQAQTQALVRFEADRVSARETDGSFSLTIRPNQPLISPIVMGVHIIPVEGADPRQITALSPQITIGAGRQSARLDLVVKDDAILTGDQTYVVQLYPLDLGDNSGILATGARQGAWYNYDVAPQDVLDRVSAIERVCDAHGVRLVDAAFQFPLLHPAHVTVIPGGQGVSEMQSNTAAAHAEIPAALWADLKSEGLMRQDAPT